MIIRNKHDEELIATLRCMLGKDELAVEKFSHVMDNILVYWNSPEFHIYTNSLFITEPTEDRPSRQGFPADVYKELGDIDNIHRELYPDLTPKREALNFFTCS